MHLFLLLPVKEAASVTEVSYVARSGYSNRELDFLSCLDGHVRRSSDPLAVLFLELEAFSRDFLDVLIGIDSELNGIK